MPKRLVTLTIGVVAVPLLGAAAYAAAMSVNDKPEPQVVIPPVRTVSHAVHQGSATTIDDHGVDPPGHDVGDDHGGVTATTEDDHGGGPGPNPGPGAGGSTSTTIDHSGPGRDGTGSGDDGSGSGGDDSGSGSGH